MHLCHNPCLPLNSDFAEVFDKRSNAPNHNYEVRPRKDKRSANLISDVLSFGRLWYGEPNAVANAIGYAQHYSRSHHAVIHVYDPVGNVIETHEHALPLTKPPFSYRIWPKRIVASYPKSSLPRSRARPRRSFHYQFTLPCAGLDQRAHW